MNGIGLSYTSYQANFSSITSTRSTDRPAESAGSESGPGASTLSSGDSVSFSMSAFEMRQDAAVVEASITHIEGSISEADITSALAGAYEAMGLFEQAGRSEYLDSIANPTDLSAEATAGRILGGITGYIFDAFKLGNPDATAEEFEAFFAQVTKGFEQGFSEALDILGGMGALTDEVNKDVHRTAEIVREGLAKFHDEATSMFTTPGVEARDSVA